MTTVQEASASTPAEHLLNWDCLEFWVGNARTTAQFFISGFGFRCTAYCGPETGVRAITDAGLAYETGLADRIAIGADH